MRLALLTLILSTFLLAQETVSIKDVSLQTSFENVTIPGGESMGLVGLNYLIHPNKYFYYGLGTYGAATGDRGGFFTGGFTVGAKYDIFKNIYLDSGLFLGGGGGASADGQGGGLMFKAYSGLMVDLGTFSLGANYSYIKFPNGNIDSQQVGIIADMKFTTTISDDNIDIESLYKYNFSSDEDYIIATYQSYFPTQNTLTRGGALRTEAIDLVGVEYGVHMTPHFVASIESAGAFSGANGYMEILGGAAYAYKLKKNIELQAKGSVGLGGGGQVDTGGGGIAKASLVLNYSPTKSITTHIGGGYFHSLNGGFDAPFAKVSLGINTNFLSAGTKKNKVDYTSIYNQKFNLRIVNQTYFYSPTLSTDPTRFHDIQLTGVKLDWFLTERFYVSGQALAAYAGKAGGYAAGMFGVGVVQPIGLGFNAVAELDVGAGAGGRVNTGGGAIAQPMAGLSYDFAKNFSFSLIGGKIIGLNGSLDANVLDVSIVYKFNKLLSK